MSEPSGTKRSAVSAWIAAELQRRFDEQAAIDKAVSAGLMSTRRRAGNGTSVVFSVRLERGELDALQRAAAVAEIKPSVLARNLIRSGLLGQSVRGGELTDALDRLAEALADVRDLAEAIAG